MNSDEIKHQLSLYIDGQLDQAERLEIEELLKSNTEWQDYYQKLLQLEKMADDFELVRDESYWTAQKDTIIDKINQAESGKIIDIQPEKRSNVIYKFITVAASIAIVAFISIYQFQEFEPGQGIFGKEDSEVKVPVKKAVFKTESTDLDDLQLPEAFEISIDDKLAKQKKDHLEIQANVEDKTTGKGQMSGQAIPSPQYVKTKSEELDGSLRPAPDIVENEEKRDRENQQIKLIKTESAGIAKYKITTSPTKNDSDDFMGEKSDQSEYLDWFEKSLQLEAKYGQFLSIHYKLASAKGRKSLSPDSLNAVILEMSEAYYKVGSLTHSSNEREKIIEKLKKLKKNADPDASEKIRRYIDLLKSNSK